MALLNPLTDQHCQCVNQVLRSISDLVDTINACEECGLDMQQRREVVQAQEKFMSAIKAKFMPNHP